MSETLYPKLEVIPVTSKGIGKAYGETELSILYLLAVSVPQQLSSSNVALLVLGLLFYFTGLVVSAVVAVWIFKTCGKSNFASNFK